MAISEKQDSHYQLPDTTTLEKAYQLNVLDENSQQHSFKSLTVGPDGVSKRIVVFIRHFFCGHCEHYIQALIESLPPSTLSTVSADLVIIGCGQPSLIPEYKKRTQSPYPIYCDPERKIYDCLGMITNLAMGEKKPEYITSSVFSVVLYSAWNGFKSGRNALAAGKVSQNGGEWVFENGEVRWCRRMRNTTDHSEMVELKEVLGLGSN